MCQMDPGRKFNRLLAFTDFFDIGIGLVDLYDATFAGAVRWRRLVKNIGLGQTKLFGSKWWQ